MAMQRRQLLALCATAALAQTVHAAPALPAAAPLPLPPGLPVARALPDELGLALAVRQPLLVMVSLEGCPYCRVARENYLLPLRERSGLAVVQVDMRSKQMLKNFQGGMQTHDEWIRSLQVRVAPSILFFGRAGVELVERMTGGYIADFYGAYLDERLRQARALLAA